MGWIRRWADEHCDDGGVELRHRELGKWEFSIWLNWTNLSLGPSVEREYGSFMWPDRLHLGFGLGPIHLSAMRTWNDVS